MKIGRKSMPLPETRADVAFILGMEEVELTHLLAWVGTLHYKTTLPKPSGEVRQLTCAKPVLKGCHHRIKIWLNGFYPHRAAHGWQAGCSTTTCANPHIGQSIVLKFDIQDFFPNISYRRVCETLQHLGCGEEAANILTSGASEK